MKIRGVNLGNWLVLEKWMSRELFRGLDARDEEEFYEELSYEEAEQRLYMHRSYFIQERDFQHIRAMGLNMVRIPVPHYIFGDQKKYPGCIGFLDLAFDWAEKYGLKILIDLHTVPDSQNGFDNGGLTGVVKWHHKKENIDYTLSVIERLAERYAGRRGLYGIELLNEPVSEQILSFVGKRYPAKDPERAKGSTAVPTEVLKDFYLRGYEAVRRHCGPETTVVIHDGFRLEEWEDFMPREDYPGLVIDTHMYLFTVESMMQDRRLPSYQAAILKGFRERLERAEQFHPVIVGEWCVANKCEEKETAVVPADIYRTIGEWETEAWEACSGWFFWSYKLHEPGRNDWDYERALDSGYLRSPKQEDERRDRF